MLLTVAIIGRPNVGKSTLFNCLTRSRDALTSSYPGTTRDRQYGKVNFEGQQFIIIDTGGITDETDEVGKLITQQALQAVQDSDKVLFMIDGKAGVTPEDQMIANTLRLMGKSVYLVVNKTENLDPDIGVAEAHELGMGTPIAIAAAHGAGLSKLVKEIMSVTPSAANSTEGGEQDSRTTTSDKPIIAIVGRPNVGKSTLINRILGEDRVIVHDSPGTTRDSIFVALERFDKHYTLIDTAGVRRRKNITELPEKFSIVKTLQAIENANVVLYVIDARLGASEQDLKLLGFILECGKALVIAVNKWDGMTVEARDHAKATIDRHLDFVRFARVHYISALHGSNVGNLFDSIDEAYASANIKMSTPELTRLLQKALVTHSPPLVHGRRVKLRYAHAGGHNPPLIVIHGNQLEDLPDSYRRFLAGYFQNRLKLHGTPVQIVFKTSENPFRK
ncbi:MAG TPA: ribosome biogenesis GTPase Der [Gammaproteobacteria bacterium]|jgi:GTP-binding protein|nr:ribosome biogenesis GTPase Der [Gammaproteobacteria bacterium]